MSSYSTDCGIAYVRMRVGGCVHVIVCIHFSFFLSKFMSLSAQFQPCNDASAVCGRLSWKCLQTEHSRWECVQLLDRLRDKTTLLERKCLKSTHTHRDIAIQRPTLLLRCLPVGLYLGNSASGGLVWIFFPFLSLFSDQRLGWWWTVWFREYEHSGRFCAHNVCSRYE